MERIDRNGGRANRAEPRPETVFIFDIHGDVLEVVCDRSEGRATRKPAEPEASLSPSVIRRWLAGFALALAGLGFAADPGMAREPAAATAAVLQSW